MELSVKKLLLYNNNWHNYLSYYGSEEHGGTVREAVINPCFMSYRVNTISAAMVNFIAQTKTVPMRSVLSLPAKIGYVIAVAEWLLPSGKKSKTLPYRQHHDSTSHAQCHQHFGDFLKATEGY